MEQLRKTFTVIAAASCICALFAASIASAQENGDLRLVNGVSKSEGRVEVYHEGQWGAVCDDSWHTADGDAVCRQLGYESAEQIFYNAKYGEGSGPIWIDQIHCPEGADSVLNCSHNGWGLHDCKHNEDAGVKCARVEPVKPEEMPIRLTCPRYTQDGSCDLCPKKRHPSPGDCTVQIAVQGIVEAYYNREWKPVSLDGWDDASAKVVCGQLGYPFVFRRPSLDELWSNWDGQHCSNRDSADPLCSLSEVQANAEFRAQLNSTWLADLECTGSEGRLLDCYFREFGPNQNPSIHQVATVRCGFGPHRGCFAPNAFKESYRTRGGAVPWSGRLEVLVNGEWGTVCDRDFDMREANIVCRAMGYGSASGVSTRASHGRGVGKIHYTNLKCRGSEYFLADCEKATGSTAQGCGHEGDVSIECTVPQSCDKDSKASKLTAASDPRHPAHTDEYAEVKGPMGWGLLCAESVDEKAAAVMCKENKKMFSHGVRSGNHSNYQGVRYRGRVECNGNEEGMNLCSVFVATVSACLQGDAILDCTANLPDLVPDLEQFQTSLEGTPYVDGMSMYYLQCALDENCLSSSARGQNFSHYRSLLRFNSQTDNLGTADFLPILDPSLWLWHSCHNHFHSFEAFIHYDLLNKTTGLKVAEGHKASFCLEDSTCLDGNPSYRCGLGHQGISRNCGDLYGRHLDCQWIDVTDVPPGTYELRQHVNPSRLSRETDYSNNIISCDITFYQGTTYFSVTNFKLSDH